MKLHRIFFLCLLGVFVVSWQLIPKIAQAQNSEEQLVEMHTSLGTITLSLSNDTPLHRDNFIKLVQDKAYDSLLFHRVIESFMIQGGDPESKTAKKGDLLGEGDLDYAVQSEFRPNLFHKKGALATAREDNLDRSSSAIDRVFLCSTRRKKE